MSWQKVTLILELLQHKKKLKRAQMLVPVLFSLLSRYLQNRLISLHALQNLAIFYILFSLRSLEPQAGNHGNMEYTKQLLLSCLLNICLKMVPESAGVTPGESAGVSPGGSVNDSMTQSISLRSHAR